MICIHVSSQFLFFIYQTCKPEQPCDCGKRYIESKFSAKAKCYTRVVKDLKPLGLACLHEFDDRDYLDVGRPYVDDEAPMVEGAFITAFNSPDCGFYVFSDKDVDGFRKVQHKIPADGIVISIETNIEPFVKGLLKASSSSFNGNVDNIFGSNILSSRRVRTIARVTVARNTSRSSSQQDPNVMRGSLRN